jgi:2-hydroxy-3-keto-5-methylthiopentenyl-1-phosphate phosphatase
MSLGDSLPDLTRSKVADLIFSSKQRSEYMTKEDNFTDARSFKLEERDEHGIAKID